MMISVILLLSAAYFSHAQNSAENITVVTTQSKIDHNENNNSNVTAERRVGTTYSSSVIHEDSNDPSQSAKSLIHVDFSPIEYKQPRFLNNGLQNSNFGGGGEILKAEPTQKFAVQTLQGLSYYQPQSQSQQDGSFGSNSKVHPTQQILLQSSTRPISSTQQILVQPSTQQINIQPSTQHISIQPPTQRYSMQQQPTQQITTQRFQNNHHKLQISPDSQTQLFNVGYSMSFKNEPPKTKPKMRNLDNGEIITGTRKGFVKRPDFGGSPSDFVERSLVNNNKLKQSSREDFDSKQILLSPITQKFLSELKSPSTTSFAQFQQDVTQKQDVDIITASQKPSWENLSPTLEIFKSTEVPDNKQYSTQLFETPKQSQQFDHAKALGKSQGFDYTNAIDGGNLKQLVTQPNSYYDISKYATAADLVYPQHDKKVVPQPQLQQQQQQQSQNSESTVASSVPSQYQQQDQQQFLVPHYEKLVALPTASNDLNKPLTIDLFNQAQNRQNDGLVYSTADPQVNPTTLQKLPLDTSLLRNPVITNGKIDNSDPKMIPINIDTRLIEQVLSRNVLEQNNQNVYQMNDYQNHHINNQELFKRTPEKYKIQPKPPQNYQKFPRPYKNKDDYVQRQPRYHNIRSIRMNKDYAQNRLRPPPYLQYKRRMYTPF